MPCFRQRKSQKEIWLEINIEIELCHLEMKNHKNNNMYSTTQDLKQWIQNIIINSERALEYLFESEWKYNYDCDWAESFLLPNSSR